ncbi:hypothetical protein BKA64DRAFT_762693 [Cadophora sp. MPI-SDFR-AT-0126]|nr:hypothetical protein BKA64DRAFT_762693 [Leotiomycetes sp. MPI-SDFR-AT-0126]
MNLHIFMAQLAAVFIFANPIPPLKGELLRRRQDLDTPEGYTVGPLHVVGDINGVPINHTGTIQEVYAQLDTEYNSFKLSALDAIDSMSAFEEQHDKREMTDVNCWPVPGQIYAEADGPAIIDGLKYLRKGDKTCNVGPQTCARVSCSWNSAIYVNKFPIAPSCKTIADFGRELNNKCRWQRQAYEHHKVGGQAWDRGNWNVYIRKDKC